MNVVVLYQTKLEEDFVTLTFFVRPSEFVYELIAKLCLSRDFKKECGLVRSEPLSVIQEVIISREKKEFFLEMFTQNVNKINERIKPDSIVFFDFQKLIDYVPRADIEKHILEEIKRNLLRIPKANAEDHREEIAEVVCNLAIYAIRNKVPI